jgi:hypothetical protein
MKIVNIFIASLVFLFCTESYISGQAGFDYKKKTTLIKSEFLEIDELIGRPYEIVIRDNLLIYNDFYDGLFLSVFDLKENRFVGRYVSRGQGPGEAIAPLNFLQFPEKNKLYVYQRNSGYLSVVSIPSFRLQNIELITSISPWKPFELQRTKDYYVGLGIFEKGLFRIYDLNCRLIFEGGKYPFKGESMNRSEAFLRYQGSYCTNPTNNFFAFGCLNCDYVAFHEINNKSIVLLKEYFTRDVNVKTGTSYNSTENTTMSQIMSAEEELVHYISAFGTESYCYMLFSGEANKFGNGGYYIIKFDWRGNYIETFQTDRKVFTFCVDEKNKFIYATALGEDGEKWISKFKL